MDKTTFKKTEGAFQKSMDASLMWYNQATTTAFQTISKQYELGIDVFKKFMDTTLNTNSTNNFWQKNMEVFMKNTEIISDLSKQLIRTSLMSFNIKNDKLVTPIIDENFVKTIMDVFDKQAKLTEQYNEKYMDLLSSQLKDSDMGFNEMKDKYKDMLKSNIEIVEDSLKTILSTYKNGTGDITSNNTAKLVEEIDLLIDFMTGSAVKFWEDMLKATNSTPNSKQTQPKTAATKQQTPANTSKKGTTQELKKA